MTVRRNSSARIKNLTCPICFERALILDNSECKNCKERLQKCTSCHFYKKICESCDLEQLEANKSKPGPEKKTSDEIVNSNSLWIWLSLIVLLFIVVSFYGKNNSNENKTQDVITFVKTLTKNYPLQNSETWYNLMSILETEKPTVKSVIFLHGESKKTLNCLIKDLVCFYSKNESLINEDITFSEVEHEGKDYGFVLEHYHSVVEKFRVLIADLTKVSGNMARIFHSLCDEISSDIKPSLFIFTLKEITTTSAFSKPLQKATNILKESWSDLPESELFPLLSRVVKNVVHIVPEEHNNC